MKAHIHRLIQTQTIYYSISFNYLCSHRSRMYPNNMWNDALMVSNCSNIYNIFFSSFSFVRIIKFSINDFTQWVLYLFHKQFRNNTEKKKTKEKWNEMKGKWNQHFHKNCLHKKLEKNKIFFKAPHISFIIPKWLWVEVRYFDKITDHDCL